MGSNNQYLKVGYQGDIGSFSEEAMYEYFTKIKENKKYNNFEDLFIALNDNDIEYAVLPIENSSTGSIRQVYDLLNQYDFYIVGEECIKIEQHLIGIKGTCIDEIKEIYSHPQGFEQSSQFLKKYNEIRLIPYLNTAISAKYISSINDKKKAAIASKRAANVYDLEILRENINDISDNYTRFIIIGKKIEYCMESNKISILLSIKNEAGSLYDILRSFSINDINMIKIESRPDKNTPWEYLFYIDFEGNLQEESVKSALKLINENSNHYKLIGCYKSKKL